MMSRPPEGKAIPYGVYDINESVGWDHDTPNSALVAADGCGAYPEATLFITADAGGSNGYRSRADARFNSWPTRPD